MTRTESLRELEGLLETFLDKAVDQSETRLSILSGLNRLDDIARRGQEVSGMTEELGDWLAEHVNWLNGKEIKTADAGRVKEILGNISQEMESPAHQTKETQKIRTEIDRWQTQLPTEPKKEPVLEPGQKIILHRGPESTEETDFGSISVFTKKLNSLMGRWEGVSAGRKHVLSALDDLLKSAYLQHNREALLLSGFIIYYLRQNGYLVEPYVKRLKAAESLIKKSQEKA
ncbi:MAG TPA: hypothetical protein VHP63_00420 [candidate division Zixibacteria bacterium]|nr:hypothetical protein [candidate division Zixibacteria bacterium]